jgi:peptidyl-prolyl cis-trans isomerase A (cyclophilin A)
MRLGLLGLCGLLVACAGVPEERHEQVVAERDALKGKLSKISQDLDKARSTVVELEQQIASVQDKPSRPPQAKVLAAQSELALEEGQKVHVTMQTTMGDIDCELWHDIAPETVLNFVGLAKGTKEWIHPDSGTKTKAPLYDGTKFHRVIKSFMIQGGDPLGNGTGGPGYRFGDEVWSDVRFDRLGLLAMANSGPNTNGSQFFITTSKPKHLHMRHTIFGLCDSEVVMKIAAVDVGGPSKSTPVKDVVLKSLVITNQ